MIISSDPTSKAKEGATSRIQHCIEWDENTDPSAIGKAIEDVIEKVQNSKTVIKNSKRKAFSPIKAGKISMKPYKPAEVSKRRLK